MDLEDKIVKDFAEWARTTQAGYGEDEADIWFEDIPAYDALEWKVREIIRTLLTEKDKELQKAREEERRRIEAIFKEHVPPHAMDLEDSVWLKRLLNKAFEHENIY